MADDELNTGAYLNPPLLAQTVLSRCAGKYNRIPVLGDMQEAYACQFDAATLQARAWYWKEVFRSVPQLTILRLQNIDYFKLAVSTALTLSGYASIVIWDVTVAYSTASAIAANSPLMLFDGAHLVLQMVGVALIAAAIAYLRFRNERSFIVNFSQQVGLLTVLLIVPTIVAYFFFAAEYSLMERGIWLSLVSVSLLSGAGLGRAIKKHSSN